jgi:hypothetical protein
MFQLIPTAPSCRNLQSQIQVLRPLSLASFVSIRLSRSHPALGEQHCRIAMRQLPCVRLVGVTGASLEVLGLQVQDGLAEAGSCCSWRLRGPWLFVNTLVSWTFERLRCAAEVFVRGFHCFLSCICSRLPGYCMIDTAICVLPSPLCQPLERPP